jgi:hypothetical protein
LTDADLPGKSSKALITTAVRKITVLLNRLLKNPELRLVS